MSHLEADEHLDDVDQGGDVGDEGVQQPHQRQVAKAEAEADRVDVPAGRGRG